MASDERDGSLSDWLSRFGISWPVRRDPLWTQAVAARGAGSHPTRSLRRFVEIVRASDHPVLLDLGPASGPSVGFLGRELGCRLVVGDLTAKLDEVTRARGDRRAVIEAALGIHAPGSFHGVFCWDLCDYLTMTEARVLGQAVARVLAPGAPALAMFSTLQYDTPELTRFGIVDIDHLTYKPFPAVMVQTHVWLGGDGSRLFAPLRVEETYLLAHGYREVLLRRSRAQAAE